LSCRDGSFKEQEAVRHKQLLKDYEKQEKKLKELKNKGTHHPSWCLL